MHSMLLLQLVFISNIILVPDTSGTLRSDDWTLMVKCVPFSKFEKQENNNKKPFARWKTTKIWWKKKLNVDY